MGGRAGSGALGAGRLLDWFRRRRSTYRGTDRSDDHPTAAQRLAEHGIGAAVIEDPRVADFLSGDDTRVLQAVWQVVATRDRTTLSPLITALPAIEEATADLDLGGALVANRTNLKHAFARLELARDGRCLCAAYPLHVFYDPAKERERGHVRITEEIPVPQWKPELICECRGCGTSFHVEQGESHYPWWQWEELS